MFRQPVRYDLVCLSHLRWDFVFQRPQHLLTRCARERRVLFFEEPTFDAAAPRLELSERAENLQVAVPRLMAGLSHEATVLLVQELLDEVLAQRIGQSFALWYYTPMAMEFSRHLRPLFRVYDCMDELANFHGAPTQLRLLERELLGRADLVFTGGHSLYEAKRSQHPCVHPFPSSVDVAHFAAARGRNDEPADQACIDRRPRLGFFGVIDERMDLELIDAIAAARPDWQLVMIGPVVKISAGSLPRRDNLHWLGGKSYAELPRYISGWDVALLPFARNDATRYISPTKTPEYLAAGRPVVSTPIRDVVSPYGDRGLVRIAETPAAFIAAIEQALCEDREAAQRRADEWLAQLSWERTWASMRALMDDVAAQQQRLRQSRPGSPKGTGAGSKPGPVASVSGMARASLQPSTRSSRGLEV